MLSNDVAYKTIEISWKCSKCGNQNSLICNLKGTGPNAAENLQDNYKAVTDENNPARFKSLFIDKKCRCQNCRNIEAWGELCPEIDDNGADETSRWRTYGELAGTSKLGILLQQRSVDKALKKLPAECFPTIKETILKLDEDKDGNGEETIATPEEIFASIGRFGR